MDSGEGDMASCPKCESTMIPEYGKMRCRVCSYQYDLPTKMPSYDELLKELQALKVKFNVLIGLTLNCKIDWEEIDDFIDGVIDEPI